MDPRIESIARNGSDLVADYVGGILASTAKLTGNLFANVETLAREVIEDSAEVVIAACDLLVPEEGDADEADEGKAAEAKADEA